MITIVGQKNCGRCTVIKSMLERNKKEYEYLLIEDLSTFEQEKYKNLAIESGKVNMPIIVFNGKCVDIKEVI